MRLDQQRNEARPAEVLNEARPAEVLNEARPAEVLCKNKFRRLQRKV